MIIQETNGRYYEVHTPSTIQPDFACYDGHLWIGYPMVKTAKGFRPKPGSGCIRSLVRKAAATVVEA